MKNAVSVYLTDLLQNPNFISNLLIGVIAAVLLLILGKLISLIVSRVKSAWSTPNRFSLNGFWLAAFPATWSPDKTYMVHEFLLIKTKDEKVSINWQSYRHGDGDFTVRKGGHHGPGIFRGTSIICPYLRNIMTTKNVGMFALTVKTIVEGTVLAGYYVQRSLEEMEEDGNGPYFYGPVAYVPIPLPLRFRLKGLFFPKISFFKNQEQLEKFLGSNEVEELVARSLKQRETVKPMYIDHD